MIDHIVLAVPVLADGVAQFQRRTGIRRVMGGSHVGLGTANYLVGLAAVRISKSSAWIPPYLTRPSHARSERAERARTCTYT